MDRLKDWWWALCVAGFLAGSLAGAFFKFNIYYLAEQSSITTLQALNTSSQSAVIHLNAIDTTLRDQLYINKTVANALEDLAVHVHTLDERADKDRTKIADALTQQGKNSEQILYLLQPKPKGK